MRIASPAGYQLEPVAGRGADRRSRARPCDGADAVYTDVWVSMSDDPQTAAERRQALAPYRLDDALLDLAAPHAIALHCLPAHPGEEITAEVLYGQRQRIWDQAENRRHAQKALLELLVAGSSWAACATPRDPARSGRRQQSHARASLRRTGRRQTMPAARVVGAKCRSRQAAGTRQRRRSKSASGRERPPDRGRRRPPGVATGSQAWPSSSPTGSSSRSTWCCSAASGSRRRSTRRPSAAGSPAPTPTSWSPSCVRRGRQQTDDLLEDIERCSDAAASSSSPPTARRTIEPVDRLVRGADRARRTVGVGPSFPILGYDDLTAGQVAGRLDGLKPAELRTVRDYERRHAEPQVGARAIERALA